MLAPQICFSSQNVIGAIVGSYIILWTLGGQIASTIKSKHIKKKIARLICISC